MLGTKVYSIIDPKKFDSTQAKKLADCYYLQFNTWLSYLPDCHVEYLSTYLSKDTTICWSRHVCLRGRVKFYFQPY